VGGAFINTSWVRRRIVVAAIAFPVAAFAQDCHLKQLVSLDMSYDHAGRPPVTALLKLRLDIAYTEQMLYATGAAQIVAAA
jgi:hypothetical protein